MTGLTQADKYAIPCPSISGRRATCYAEYMPELVAHPHQKIHSFLQHHPMGVLSTVSADGTPWGSAIYYIADKNFNFFFVTRVETFKYDNMDANPIASLTVADDTAQTTVQVFGTISHVPPQDYMEIVFEKLASVKPKDDHMWTPPLNKIHAGNYMPLRLTPTKLQYADFKKRKSDIHATYIEQIIPN